MSLIRWDPFANLDESFNRMLPGLLGRWPRFELDSGAAKLEWRPSANISETSKEYLIRAELPAVPKEDVKVTVDEGTITIQGERRQEKRDESEKMHRVESFYGHFARSFALPENADVAAVRCESKDGVLTVHIPKRAAATQQPRQIKVE
jgi:HSP20 family protein